MSLPTNLDLNGRVENHTRKEFKNGKFVNGMNGKNINNNNYEMNHSSNHKNNNNNNNGKNNENSFIYDGEKEENGDHDDTDNNNNHNNNNNNNKILNGDNSEIDTEIKEKEFKNQCNKKKKVFKNEPQNTTIPSSKNLDDPIEDWQILKVKCHQKNIQKFIFFFFFVLFCLFLIFFKN